MAHIIIFSRRAARITKYQTMKQKMTEMLVPLIEEDCQFQDTYNFKSPLSEYIVSKWMCE